MRTWLHSHKCTYVAFNWKDYTADIGVHARLGLTICNQ